MRYAGTLHIVFLIALADLKATVRNMRISEVNDVARLLRDPSSTCTSISIVLDLNGVQVDASLSIHITTIISSITSLHRHINLRLHTLLSEERRDSLQIPEVISSNGIVDSDVLFDDIRFL